MLWDIQLILLKNNLQVSSIMNTSVDKLGKQELHFAIVINHNKEARVKI